MNSCLWRSLVLVNSLAGPRRTNNVCFIKKSLVARLAGSANINSLFMRPVSPVVNVHLLDANGTGDFFLSDMK